MVFRKRVYRIDSKRVWAAGMRCQRRSGMPVKQATWPFGVEHPCFLQRPSIIGISSFFIGDIHPIFKSPVSSDVDAAAHMRRGGRERPAGMRRGEREKPAGMRRGAGSQSHREIGQDFPGSKAIRSARLIMERSHLAGPISQDARIPSDSFALRIFSLRVCAPVPFLYL